MSETTRILGTLPVCRGEYSGDDTYYKDNIVNYQGGVYQCKNNNIVGVVPTNTDNWLCWSAPVISKSLYMFIYNGLVVSYNDHILSAAPESSSSSNTVAKYTRVDMGSNVTKVFCKFIYRGGTIALVSTANDLYGNIANITKGSLHIIFSSANVSVQMWDETGLYTVGLIVHPNALILGEEYEFGFDIKLECIDVYHPMINNKIPISTDSRAPRTVEEAIAKAGKYFIFEMFTNNVQPLDYETIDWNCSRFTAIRCDCENGTSLIDTFDRPNGPLGVAPSGHVYQCFRNECFGDTKYDFTNQAPNITENEGD